MSQDYLEILATCGTVILIDKEDHHFVEGKSVSLGVNRLYGMIKDEHEGLRYIHRLVMNANDSMQVDHINMNTHDNRKCNLRMATKSQNRANQKKSVFSKDLTSSFKGVCYDRTNGNWLCRVSYENHETFNGRFTNEIAAALAYNHYAKEAFKEFARLNKIPIEHQQVDWRGMQIIKQIADVQSGYKYVTFIQEKWLVKVTVEGKQHKIGRFTEKHEAVLAANNAVIVNGLHRLNKYKKVIQQLKDEEYSRLTKEQLGEYIKQLKELNQEEHQDEIISA